MDKEEGEMSDDNSMLVDVKNPIENEVTSTLIYKSEKNGLVIEQLEKIDAFKLEERAKRFGLNLTGNRIVTQTQIDELYAKSGIESGNERHFRFDAIHLHGIDDLTTREIFEYLEDYKPVSLEKVDEVSCNVVCQDHISAALALLVHSREIRNEELKKMLAEKSCHHWREGMPHPKKDLILMRFATNGDKKIVKKKPENKHPDESYDQDMESLSKNPWGDLCKSWGVYDHQEIFQRKLVKKDYEDYEYIEQPAKPVKIKNKQLAMRLGKRSQGVEDEEDSSSDSEWKKKSKKPRMRMHADDEETKQQKKKQVIDVPEETDRDIYAPLSIEVTNTESSYIPRETTKLSDKFRSNIKNHSKSRLNIVHSRLGGKVHPTNETLSNDDYSSDDSGHNIMSRVQKVHKQSSVWSRLETKSKDSSQSDLRQILKSRKQKSSDDLRDRIGKSKKSILRIEIDNNYADN